MRSLAQHLLVCSAGIAQMSLVYENDSEPAIHQNDAFCGGIHDSGQASEFIVLLFY